MGNASGLSPIHRNRRQGGTKPFARGVFTERSWTRDLRSADQPPFRDRFPPLSRPRPNHLGSPMIRLRAL